MTAALDFLHPAPARPAPEAPDDRPPLRVVGPAEIAARPGQIPLQPGPIVTVSLTQGCDVPLEALRAAPDRGVSCHPCDEAVVLLLLQCVRRADGLPLSCNRDIAPGTLRLG